MLVDMSIECYAERELDYFAFSFLKCYFTTQQQQRQLWLLRFRRALAKEVGTRERKESSPGGVTACNGIVSYVKYTPYTQITSRIWEWMVRRAFIDLAPQPRCGHTPIYRHDNTANQSPVINSIHHTYIRLLSFISFIGKYHRKHMAFSKHIIQDIVMGWFDRRFSREERNPFSAICVTRYLHYIVDAADTR